MVKSVLISVLCVFVVFCVDFAVGFMCGSCLFLWVLWCFSGV